MSSARKFCIASCVSVLVGYSCSIFAAVERIGDFALLDDRGEFHQLSRYLHRKAVVMMSYSNTCDDISSSLAHFEKLQKEYAGQNVEFLLLDSNGAGREKARAWDMDYPVLDDEAQLVSETLGVETAGQVLVFNPERLTLLYRGPASEPLDDALAKLMLDDLRDTVSVETPGCQIEYKTKQANLDSPPDYSTEIAPIIVKNCSECHRWGGVGPFALDAYVSVLGWSPMIREVLMNKRMPPMQVDPEIGHSDSAKYITAKEIQTLLHWMDAGAPRGDNPHDPLEDVPLEKTFEWQLGEPDYVVEADPVSIPAVGVQDYVYTDVTLPFDKDVRIEAFQYRPGKEAVLHHLMTFVVPADEDFWGLEKDQEISHRRFLGSYIPGENPAIIFPEGASVLVPKGYKLAMQFHYVTNGLATVDESSIGLYFAKDSAITEIETVAVSSRFVIPPNVDNFPMEASYKVEDDIVVTGLRARMNFRGKKMKFVVESPAGEKHDIFSIPAYNYGWQPHYQLETAEEIVAGSTVHVVGAFDNSLSNPFNPDPSEEVRFGINSFEEMFTGYLTFYRK
jgi:peroxiredoxin